MAQEGSNSHQTQAEKYLEKQKAKVEEELTEWDSGLVLDFLKDKEDELAPTTARNYARELRFLIKRAYDIERYSEDPEDWDSSDWERLIKKITRERDVKNGTKRNTCYATRAFVDFLPDSSASKDEISAPKITHSKIDEEEVLDPEEVVTLIETAHTERDSAIIGVMYEAALRRTALTQLDIKDYKTDDFARIRLPHKEGVKTGHGRQRPLNWSAGYLDRWLNQHPEPDNPDAPLFCSIRAGRDEGQRLTAHAIYTMLQRVGKKTDIDDDRIHPHALRHARATAMRKSDQLDNRDIETVMGWTDSTPMHARYEHTTSKEDASRTAVRMGIDTSSNSDKNKIVDCPRCDTKLPTGARYCPACTLRISEEPPEWWKLFSNIAKETDPLHKKYDAIPTAVPELSKLDVQELEHLYNVLLTGEMLMYDDSESVDEHPFDGVSAFDTEKEADRALELTDEIGEELGSILTEKPEQVELVEDSVDMSNIQKYADEVSED